MSRLRDWAGVRVEETGCYQAPCSQRMQGTAAQREKERRGSVRQRVGEQLMKDGFGGRERCEGCTYCN